MKNALPKLAFRQWGRLFSLSLGLLFFGQALLFASSHREAPLIADDPLADNVDVYAFRSPDNPEMITLVATYIPLQLPHGGPNYYHFGENVRYEIHVDNNTDTPGDDVTYRFTFDRVNEDPTTFFNIRLGAENINTTYTLEKSMDGGQTWSTIISDGPTPPYYIGDRSITGGAGLGASSYSQLMQDAFMDASTGERVFAGPTDDPFWVDLGGVFDLGDLPRQGSDPRDGLACFNVSALVIQVPIGNLLKDGAPSSPTSILDPDYVIGVWASASRPQTLTLGGGEVTGSGDWVQVSRLGMPLTNEVVIPVGMKDFWNSITPYDEFAETTLDENFYNPELALYMDDAQFGGAVPAFAPLRIQTNSLGAFNFTNGNDGLFPLKGSPAVAGTALDDAVFGTLLLPDAGKPRSVDLWPIFHTGVPNVRPYHLATGKMGDPLAAGKPFIHNFLPNGGDMLRLNMAVPPTPRDDPNFSNQGLLQAAVLGLTDPAYNQDASLQFIPNMDGFPNGRRLEDHVTEIELKAVSGIVLAAIGLWYDDFDPMSSPSPVTQDLLDVLTYSTGVTMNDARFQDNFPYLAMPWAGDGPCSGNVASTTGIDLELAITADANELGIYQNVTYTVMLTNRGPATATGIEVSAGLPSGLVHTGNSTTLGTYNLFFETWKVPSLEAGQSATLNLTLFTLVNNVDITNFVQVTAADQNDIDSTPDNNAGMTPNEDDEAAVTITVNLAPQDPADLALASPFTNVYPQPAANAVTFELELEEEMGRTNVQVLDAAGNVVLNQGVHLSTGFNQFQFDISNLNSGMYFVKVEGLAAENSQKRFSIVK